ncbi:MAG: dihydrodipicolinate synthase family protein [Rhodospirillaceae bacterium]|nr:dihydrodipicolinate synthase family protein [Rhodospirillaceae bacterium]
MTLPKRVQPYTGVYPIAPTPFHEDETIDLEGQKRVLDCMIDQKVDGICILANYSEQFLLTDEERDQLAVTCIEHIAGRVPVIVTCSHFSTRVSVERAKKAEAIGAEMIMVMPPYHGVGLKASKAGNFTYFESLAKGISIPIMVQDAPLSGVSLSVNFLAKLANLFPQICYFKIETSGAAKKLRDLIAAGGESIQGPFDGEESITLMADLNAGATGTMPSALLPDLIRPVVMRYLDGDEEGATNLYNAILPLINFENRQCGLRAAKIAMVEGGVIKHETVRHPLEEVDPETRLELLRHALKLDLVALRWGK